MCEFCKPDDYGNREEFMNQIKKEPIGIGDCEEVLQLEAWIMNNDKGDDPKLFVCISVPCGGYEIKTMDIPIKYCPKCGREL